MTTICLLVYMLIKPWSRIRSLGWMDRDRIRSAWTARTFSSIPRWFSPLTIRNAPFSPHFVPQLFKQIYNATSYLKLIIRMVDTLNKGNMSKYHVFHFSTVGFLPSIFSFCPFYWFFHPICNAWNKSNKMLTTTAYWQFVQHELSSSTILLSSQVLRNVKNDCTLIKFV